MTAPPSTRVHLKAGERLVLDLVRRRFNRSEWLIKRTGFHERTIHRYLLDMYRADLIDRYRWEEETGKWEYHYTVTPAGRDALAAS